MAEKFVSIDVDDILVGEELPGTVYLYIDFRFITYRAGGDTLDRNAYDRLQLKRVRNLFIVEADQPKFRAWAASRASEVAHVKAEEAVVAQTYPLYVKAKEDAHRAMMDIFQSSHPDKMVKQTMQAGKHLVNEVMKFTYSVRPLNQLQSYSRGTADHSVNVSVLSVYLAMQMGYTHAVILQHIGVGSLLHDLGKTQVEISDDDTPALAEEKMHAHPDLGVGCMDLERAVPNEVKMIIAQHHECVDGTGYPRKLRLTAIYDLARIVAIANTFDELVADGRGPLLDRQKTAITRLDKELYKKFDPQKLDKAMKILKLGI